MRVAAVLCHIAHLRTQQQKLDEGRINHFDFSDHVDPSDPRHAPQHSHTPYAAATLFETAARTYEERFGSHPDLAITLADLAAVLAQVRDLYHD